MMIDEDPEDIKQDILTRNKVSLNNKNKVKRRKEVRNTW